MHAAYSNIHQSRHCPEDWQGQREDCVCWRASPSTCTCGLPSEDEIALANINKRKPEAEEKRKTAEKNRKADKLKKLSVDRVTTTANDKENAKPSKKKKVKYAIE